MLNFLSIFCFIEIDTYKRSTKIIYFKILFFSQNLLTRGSLCVRIHPNPRSLFGFVFVLDFVLSLPRRIATSGCAGVILNKDASSGESQCTSDEGQPVLPCSNCVDEQERV